MHSAPGPKHLYSTRDENLWLRVNEASLQTLSQLFHVYGDKKPAKRDIGLIWQW